MQLWLTLTLYMAAIIIVFFCDCRADRYVPRSQVTTWGHIKSWIKRLAELRLLVMIGQSVLTLATLAIGTLFSLFKWLFPDPTPEQKRRRRKTKRIRRVIRAHRAPSPPRPRSSFARAMAASTVGSQLMANSAYAFQVGEPYAALRHVLNLHPPEPPQPSVFRQYLSAFSLVVDSTELQETRTQPETCMFDTDSKPIGIDSRASACISDDPADFPYGYTLTKRKVKVFGGMFHGKVYQGVLRWAFQEDAGKIDTQEIPGLYFIPEGGMRLLSPQHWSQQ